MIGATFRVLPSPVRRISRGRRPSGLHCTEQFPDISRIPRPYSPQHMSAPRIKLVGISLACLVAAGAFAGVARSLFTPAWSYLPAATRAQLAKQQGGSLFLPARTPLFYRYRSGAQGRERCAERSLHEPRSHPEGPLALDRTELRLAGAQAAGRARRATSGPRGRRRSRSTATRSSVRDRPTGAVAWRCVTNAHGTYVLSASNGGKLSAVGPRDRGRERPRRESPPVSAPAAAAPPSLDRGTHLRPPAVDSRPGYPTAVMERESS